MSDLPPRHRDQYVDHPQPQSIDRYARKPDADYMRVEDCIPGHLYRLRSRNLLIGVFNPSESGDGFTGIREKFGRLYLDTEYHYDTGQQFGTARPVEDLGECPLTDLREGWATGQRDGSHLPKRCLLHDRELVWIGNDGVEGNYPGWNYHKDDCSKLDRDDMPKYENNTALFKWLEEAERKISEES